MNSMKEAMAEFEATRAEVEEIKGKVAASRAISAHYRLQLQKQIQELIEKKQRKQDLLEGMDGISPEAVEQFSRELADMERKVSGLKELCDASEAGTRRSQDRLYRARVGVFRRRERAVFRLVADEKINTFKTHLPQLKEAFVAWQLAGGSSDFLMFMTEVMGLRPFLGNARNEQHPIESGLREKFNLHRP